MAYDIVPPPLMNRPRYVPELLQMPTHMRSRTHAPDSWYQLVRGCKAIILFTSVAIWDHVSQINHDPRTEGVAYLVENWRRTVWKPTGA